MRKSKLTQSNTIIELTRRGVFQNYTTLCLFFDNSPVDPKAILLTSTNLQVSIPPLIR
jgi:hypothetical protein